MESGVRMNKRMAGRVDRMMSKQAIRRRNRWKDGFPS